MDLASQGSYPTAPTADRVHMHKWPGREKEEGRGGGHQKSAERDVRMLKSFERGVGGGGGTL